MPSILAQSETAARGAGPAFLRTKRLSLIVGGTMDEKVRREVEEGRRPRIDVLEMESRFGARLYDFATLRRDAESSRPARTLLALARRTGLWSASLAQHVLGSVREDDLVYATGEDVGYPLALLMRARRVRRPRLVVRLDQPVLGRGIARRVASEMYIHMALKRMDRIACHSNVQVHYLNSVAGVPMEALGLARPKVDGAFFSPDHEPTADRGFVPPEPYVLSAGMEMRDYPTLIEAVRGLPLTLVIAAGSPWSHFRFKHEQPLPPNVVLSRFSPVQMRELYRSARFVVVPVRPTLRTCGITVVMEGWAMEKAVVASRTVGLLDYLREGEDALLVPPRDQAALRDRVTRLLENPEEAERLGRRGRERVGAELSIERFIAEMERLFTDVLTAGG